MNTRYFLLSTGDSDYLNQIGTVIGKAKLYATGCKELIGQPGIGICGSRDASADALEWAFKFGQEAANRGLLVVSGYARGIDRQAHKGALVAGGNTIAVLPEGIEGFSVRKELTDLIDLDRNFAAVSMFEPEVPWKSWRAMTRNKLIIALSLGLFVVEASEKGGTINAAMECVRQNKPLWAVAYSDRTPQRVGNELLLQDSAIPLTRMKDVKAALDQAAASQPEAIKQLALEMAGA